MCTLMHTQRDSGSRETAEREFLLISNRRLHDDDHFLLCSFAVAMYVNFSSGCRSESIGWGDGRASDRL